MSRVATADPLWKIQSTHSLSVPGGARKGKLSIEQSAQNSLLTRWSLACSSLNRYGCLSSPRMGVPGERMTEESYATLSWDQLPAKFKAERLFRGWCIGSREGVFLVLTSMPRPILKESCTASIKDFAIFSPYQKQTKKSYAVKIMV